MMKRYRSVIATLAITVLLVCISGCKKEGPVERAGKKVRLGLGPERFLLALLSRCGLLAVIRRYAGPLYACFSRSHVSCEKR